MGIFYREEKEHWEHYGWFFGIVPVYLRGVETGDPEMVTRNWIPEWPLDLAEAICGFFIALNTMTDPLYEPSYPILITGEI